MPISSDRFDELGGDGTGAGRETNADRILAFLRANPDTAYTQSEIAEQTDVTEGSVGPTLVRLRERGRVDHRGTYWRISDAERAVDAAATHSAATAASHEREEETPSHDEWQAYAVDPRTLDDG